MKRVIAGLVVLLSLAGAVYAQEEVIEPYVDSGSMIAMAGIGYGGLAAGFEYDFFRLNAGPVPLTFGAAVRGAFDPLFQEYGTSIAVGGFAMVHVGFKGLRGKPGMDRLERLDYYLGLGVGYANASYDELNYKVEGGLGFSWLTGASWYFNDNIALYVEYGYIGKYTVVWYDFYRFTFSPYYATIGVSWKF